MALSSSSASSSSPPSLPYVEAVPAEVREYLLRLVVRASPKTAGHDLAGYAASCRTARDEFLKVMSEDRVASLARTRNAMRGAWNSLSWQLWKGEEFAASVGQLADTYAHLRADFRFLHQAFADPDDRMQEGVRQMARSHALRYVHLDLVAGKFGFCRPLQELVAGAAQLRAAGMSPPQVFLSLNSSHHGISASLREISNHPGVVDLCGLALHDFDDWREGRRAKGREALSLLLKAQLHTLRHLNLHKNGLDFSDPACRQFLRHLSEILGPHRRLTVLHLSGNAMGDGGAQMIAAALRRNRSLEVLSLDDCQIGVAGFTALADALRKNRTLKKLSVGAVRDADLQPLAPHCGRLFPVRPEDRDFPEAFDDFDG